MAESFFVTCPRGLESLLEQELLQLGATHTVITDGGIQCDANELSFMYDVNLESRLASRVLWKIDEGHYNNENDLYNLAYHTRWERYFSVEKTIKVQITSINSPLQSLNFATLKIKDAICDRFRVNYAKRPSVETTWPDVRICIFLNNQHCIFYIDTSGDALFKRGWREETQEAPIRENLAAGILKLAGWTPDLPLFDPFCGSGTFLIEAAHQKLNRAPGLKREFAFQHLLKYNPTEWAEKHQAAVKRFEDACALCEKESAPTLLGRDIDETALHAARHNAKIAGVQHFIHFEMGDATTQHAAPFNQGIWLCNPPYGVRLSDQKALEQLYPQLGDTLKQFFAGWKAYFFTGDQRLPKLIRLSTTKRTPLYNGALECRLYEFIMMEGRPKRKELTGSETKIPSAQH